MKKKLLLTLAMALMLCALFAVGVDAATEGVLTYFVSGGEATITDCDTSASGTLIIPSELGGAPVTSIW